MLKLNCRLYPFTRSISLTQPFLYSSFIQSHKTCLLKSILISQSKIVTTLPNLCVSYKSFLSMCHGVRISKEWRSWGNPGARQSPLMAPVSLFGMAICPFVIKPCIKSVFCTGSSAVLECAFWKLTFMWFRKLFMIETNHQTIKIWHFCQTEESPSALGKSRIMYNFEVFGKYTCDIQLWKALWASLTYTPRM